MIIGIIKIEAMKEGISVDQIALTDQSQALPEERAIAGVIDAGIKIAGEFVARNAGKGTVIEGKDIEREVDAMLQKYHLKSFRDQLRQAGIKIPPQRG
jgi:hypothetical protein